MDAAPLGQTVRRCSSDVEWGLRVRRCIAAATRGPRRCPRAIPFVARGTEFAPGGSWLRGACQDGSNQVQPSSSQSQDLIPGAANQHVVPGQYIVVFKRGVANSHALAQTLLAAHGGSLRQAYASALKGFAARLPDAAVGAL